MADSNTLMAMWYGKRWPWLSVLLLPLSWLFHLLITLRRAYYRRVASSGDLPVPVIVVGNINLGGSGKSPLLIALALRLRQRGFSPGVISRGYGSHAPHYPFVVGTETPAELAGDEPLMIAQTSACPVVIDANRLAAAKKLIEMKHCDLILSDDGLQHYRLPRDLEIVVVDGQRWLGNERLLPAGPLRESVSRLGQVDWVAVNGGLAGEGLSRFASEQGQGQRKVDWLEMQLRPVSWRPVYGDTSGAVEQAPWESVEQALSKGQSKGKVHAVAGIGNPQRFFQTLRELGVDFIPHSFPDHHNFQWADIHFHDDLPVVMTEKDAVKCRALLKEKAACGGIAAGRTGRYWYLSVQAKVDENFYSALEVRLRALQKRKGQASSSSSASAGK